MNKNFTIRELTKRGFERREDLDFTDDGNHFRCFTYRGFKVTYLKSDNQYYLDIDIDFANRPFSYAEARDTDWIDLPGEFNGVDEIDVDKFVANFDVIEKGIKDLENKINSIKIDMNKIENYRQKEIKAAEEAVKYFKANYNWYDKDNKWDLWFDISVVKNMEASIENVRNMDLSKKSPKDLREYENRIDNEGYMNYSLTTDKIYNLCRKVA